MTIESFPEKLARLNATIEKQQKEIAELNLELDQAHKVADNALRSWSEITDTNEELLKALERLSSAALSRDATMGDQCSLIKARAELAEANKQAFAVIKKVKGL